MVRHISIDVECVATGKGHNDRAAASVAMVDERGEVLLNLKIKQTTPILDYLTDYSGLTEQDFENALPFDEVVRQVKAILHQDPQTILVGQSLSNDINWLKLQEGIDYSGVVDLAQVFKSNSGAMYSLAFTVKTLLSSKLAKGHSAVKDATNAMKLFTQFGQDTSKTAKAKKRLETAWKKSPPGPRPASFKGICLMKYNARRCICNPQTEGGGGGSGGGGGRNSTSRGRARPAVHRRRDYDDDDDEVHFESETMWEARARGTFDPHNNYIDDQDGIYGDFYGNYGGRD